MRLGLNLGYWGSSPVDGVAMTREAESLGFDSVWTAEAYGSDAITPLAYLAALTSRIKLGTAIMQIPARTPANCAMTTSTLDALSGGRMLVGLGLSGPQVVEGWHGQPWGRPLTRAREYIEVVRRALRRETLEFRGEELSIPYGGPGATGLGKPLKMMLHPLRSDIPIYLAALGPRQVELAFEIADGWLPMFFSPEKAAATFNVVPKDGFDIAPGVPLVLSDDLAAARDSVRPRIALYVGGMGAPGRNFYNDVVRRYGYEREARLIQELYLGGKQREAGAAVPDALVDEVSLVGSRERIAERLAAWTESGVGTLVVQSDDPAAMRCLAELVL